MKKQYNKTKEIYNDNLFFDNSSSGENSNVSSFSLEGYMRSAVKADDSSGVGDGSRGVFATSQI